MVPFHLLLFFPLHANSVHTAGLPLCDGKLQENSCKPFTLCDCCVIKMCASAYLLFV